MQSLIDMHRDLAFALREINEPVACGFDKSVDELTGNEINRAAVNEGVCA